MKNKLLYYIIVLYTKTSLYRKILYPMHLFEEKIKLMNNINELIESNIIYNKLYRYIPKSSKIRIIKKYFKNYEKFN